MQYRTFGFASYHTVYCIVSYFIELHCVCIICLKHSIIWLHIVLSNTRLGSTVQFWVELHYIALFCTVLLCITLYCMVLCGYISYYHALNDVGLCSIVLNCVFLYNTASLCIVSWVIELYCIKLHCVVWYCITLCWITFCCMIIYCDVLFHNEFYFVTLWSILWHHIVTYRSRVQCLIF